VIVFQIGVFQWKGVMDFLMQSSSPDFSAALQSLEASNAAVQAMRFMLGPRLYFEWAHTIGVATHSRLRDASSPIPPLSLRSIVAAPEEEIFLSTGGKDIATFMSLFIKHRTSSADRPVRVFDFGCGCGRLSRFLNTARAIEAYASDINKDHVEWCASNLRQVTTKVNGAVPPLPFEDRSFDLAYSLSIFTHLEEHVASAWLGDLSRVLATGGILILTTHGIPTLKIIKESKVHQDMFNLSRREIEIILTNLADTRYVFISYEQATLDAAKAGSSYGNTFMHPNYAAGHWNAHGLEILQHIPGGLRGWQDIFVLQKK
jgi:SAM-dependent methyltransferase